MRLPEDGKKVAVGFSHLKQEISLQRFGSGQLKVLLLGGVHGNESEGFLFIEKFLEEIESGEMNFAQEISLFVCPRVNPDGCAVVRRTNHRNVDLNRNLPTRDWTETFTDLRYYPGPSAGSEPESAATIRMLELIKPDLILSLHSYEKPMVNYNGECEDLAKAMSKKNGLIVSGDIGYPTPGSLGTYAGWERDIPTITLEIMRGQEPKPVYHQHKEGIVTAIHYYVDHPHPTLAKKN